MDYTRMNLIERANCCLNICIEDGEGATPKCSDNFNENRRCGFICCGHCPDYTGCGEKCRQVWIDPRRIIDNPKGRLVYVVLDTGQLISGSIPCLISEMYDDNE